MEKKIFYLINKSCEEQHTHTHTHHREEDDRFMLNGNVGTGTCPVSTMKRVFNLEWVKDSNYCSIIDSLVSIQIDN
jgi:hypothetical protein